MTKKQPSSRAATVAIWLFVAAVLIEVGNVILTVSLGARQMDVCPKSTTPWDISLSLSLVSLLLVAAAVITVYANKLPRLYATFYGVFWLLVILAVGYCLRFAAVGGLDWCGLVW